MTLGGNAFVELPCQGGQDRQRLRVSPLHLYLALHGAPCQIGAGSNCAEVRREGNQVVLHTASPAGDCRVSISEFERALSEAFGIRKA